VYVCACVRTVYTHAYINCIQRCLDQISKSKLSVALLIELNGFVTVGCFVCEWDRWSDVGHVNKVLLKSRKAVISESRHDVNQ
jgi:hypothetical protein